MNDLHATWEGTFNIFGVEVRCYVLNDGRRIIDAGSVVELFDAMHRDAAAGDDLAEFVRWQQGGES